MTRLQSFTKSWARNKCGTVGMTFEDYITAVYQDYVGFCRHTSQVALSKDEYLQQRIYTTGLIAPVDARTSAELEIVAAATEDAQAVVYPYKRF